MKLKYYLRGLGVGIICTAIIMGIALSGNKKETLTDAEIIERARLLGMVMEEETSDQEKPEDGTTPENQDTGEEQPDSDKTEDTKSDGTEAGNPNAGENPDAEETGSEDPEEPAVSQGDIEVGLEVRQHSAQPSLIHIEHAAALCFCLNGILRLLLGTYKKNGAAFSGNISHCLVGLIYFAY